LQLWPILHKFRRIVWRFTASVPLNCHFVAAGLRENGAEMALVRQLYGSNSPPCQLGCRRSECTGASRQVCSKDAKNKDKAFLPQRHKALR